MSNAYGHVIGNLTRDPEVRYTSSETAVVKFSVAVHRHWKGEEEVSYFDVVLFGKRGEAFAKFHSQGTACFVSGEWVQERWESKSGEKRSKNVLRGSDWGFLPKGPERKVETEPAVPELDEGMPF